jgi:bifunctional UDP-N-acetylglucosamine pyrophosphorylase/glucosamine-1-phosphate N-acetyltransferase
MVEAEKIIHSSSTVAAIVLAAGQGKRMQSNLPKVLHEIAGKPILAWVLDALAQAGLKRLALVIGGELGQFSKFINRYHGLTVCEQERRRGTGDAVAAAAVCFDNVTVPHFASQRLLQGERLHAEYVLICTGDAPAIQADVIADFIVSCLKKRCAFGVLGMETSDPTGYGRLVVGPGDCLEKIVEHRDANPKELKIQLCNSGIIFAQTKTLFHCLNDLEANNTQNEYYLTDIFEIAVKKNLSTFVYQTKNWQSFAGINDPEQKAKVEEYMINGMKRTH